MESSCKHLNIFYTPSRDLVECTIVSVGEGMVHVLHYPPIERPVSGGRHADALGHFGTSAEVCGRPLTSLPVGPIPSNDGFQPDVSETFDSGGRVVGTAFHSHEKI